MMTELKIGTKVKDRYTLKEYKGSGSFGEVWLAHDDVLDCDLAVKIYISLDPRGVEEFKSEFVTTTGISHPNLLTTTHFDVWEQRPFLVMKYCAKGSTSAQVGKMSETALWQFIHDVAAGLNYLHNISEPIIHQDIKPDNILIDDYDRYLITDFGISKKIRSTMRKQSNRAIGAGAVAYMGPERFKSDPTPVKASDIWSLGASIYELATGELPFNGLGGVMLRNGTEMPSLDDKWSKDMQMVMQSCLAKETRDRPTAQQLEEFADAILNGRTAEVTWTTPSVNNGEEPASEPYDNSTIPFYDGKEETNSNKNKIWIGVGVSIVVIILIIILCPSGKTGEQIVIPEDTVEDVDVEVMDIVEDEDKVGDIPEVQPTQQEGDQSTTSQPKQEEQKVATEAPKTDNNAALLKNAFENEDYQQVQKLANQGYAAAYGPLAKYYLRRHDYQAAETYAKKAQAAGFSDGTEVLETLWKLGYYD